MKLKRRTEQRTSLRITPLIDVVLLLLIFFLLTSSFVNPASVDVNLPETSGGSSSARATHRITITDDGTVFLNDEEVTVNDLQTKLSDGEDRRISIYGDTRSSLGTFLRVWTALREAGVNLFQVRVVPKQGSSSSETSNGS